MIHNNFFRVLGQKNKNSQILANWLQSVQTIEKAALHNVLKGSFITSKLKSIIKNIGQGEVLAFL